MCALVIGVYAYSAHSAFLVSTSLDPSGDYYNLMVQGFCAGQLNLKREVPPELAALSNPYDPVASSRSRVLDMSYYKGKLYLYYGVTPVLVLFWPYVTLTGRYLSQKDAAVIFCAAGFLASAAIFWSLWRRYFAQVSVATVAAGTLGLGLATGIPFLLARCDVYEVCISCGYAFSMLALAAIWKALREQRREGWWLAAASLAYGLAVAARPSLLFGAVILMVPVVRAWRERREARVLLIAAMAPIMIIGLGLMLYNTLRFDHPFEFGWRYALAGDRLSTVRPFSLRYLWFHFRVYFLGLARWSGRFPFVHDITVPPVPVGHGRVEHPFGVLTNIPLVWLALVLLLVPLLRDDRLAEMRSTLGWFLAAVALLFGTGALTMNLFFAASFRYEVEFLPSLVLLAVIGILSLERALAPSSGAGLVRQPVWRRTARWGWGLLLSASVMFNLLVSVGRCAEAHYNLGYVLERMGRMPGAMTQYEQALRLNPDYAEAQIGLGNRLIEAGKMSEAITHYEQAVRSSPDWADARNNLGVVLVRLGKLTEAVEQFQQALRIDHGLADVHSNLAVALARLGRMSEAVEHFDQSLRLKPEDAETHYDFAAALEQAGRAQEAKLHYEQALRLRPDFAEARNRLARLATAR